MKMLGKLTEWQCFPNELYRSNLIKYYGCIMAETQCQTKWNDWLLWWLNVWESENSNLFCVECQILLVICKVAFRHSWSITLDMFLTSSMPLCKIPSCSRPSPSSICIKSFSPLRIKVSRKKSKEKSIENKNDVFLWLIVASGHIVRICHRSKTEYLIFVSAPRSYLLYLRKPFWCWSMCWSMLEHHRFGRQRVAASSLFWDPSRRRWQTCTWNSSSPPPHSSSLKTADKPE